MEMESVRQSKLTYCHSKVIAKAAFDQKYSKDHNIVRYYYKVNDTNTYIF